MVQIGPRWHFPRARLGQSESHVGQNGRFACPVQQIPMSSGPWRMPTWSFCVPCAANTDVKWAPAHANMVVLRALCSKYGRQVGPSACQHSRFACPVQQIRTSSGPQRMPTWSFCVPCAANTDVKWSTWDFGFQRPIGSEASNRNIYIYIYIYIYTYR